MKDPIRWYLTIDWYDGTVTGILELASEPGQWLATLVAWAPERRVRAFGLVRLSPGQLANLQVAANRDLESAVRVARSIITHADEAQLLVTSHNTTEDVLARRPLETSELVSIATFDVADAVAPAVQRYLEVPRSE